MYSSEITAWQQIYIYKKKHCHYWLVCYAQAFSNTTSKINLSYRTGKAAWMDRGVIYITILIKQY